MGRPSPRMKVEVGLLLLLAVSSYAIVDDAAVVPLRSDELPNGDELVSTVVSPTASAGLR